MLEDLGHMGPLFDRFGVPAELGSRYASVEPLDIGTGQAWLIDGLRR